MLLARRQPDKPAAATNKFCSIRTRNGLYTEFGIDPKNALFIVIEHHQFLSAILIKVHQINFEYTTCAAFILNFIKPESAMLCNGSVNHIRIQLGGIDSLLTIR